MNQRMKTAVLLALAMATGSAAALDLWHLGQMAAKEVRAASKDSTASSEAKPPKLPAYTGDFRDCRDQFANGRPPVIQGESAGVLRPLCFDGFAVMHSSAKKTPLYSAEALDKGRLAESAKSKRTNFFWEEERLPSSERARLDDYRGSGFDRGHMSPAADMPTPNAMSASFTLSNIVPQDQNNNRYAWAEVESATRKYIRRAKGTVYVMTGPAYVKGMCTIQATLSASNKSPAHYNQHDCTIGRGRVAVPTHLYKLVYDPSANRAWAHWVENTPSARIGEPISYAELVRRTGIEFLPGVHPN